MLKELRIKNYRCFEDFFIKDLAQVNLIVGDNNIGKSSFLEAIYLLMNRKRDLDYHLRELLYKRSEFTKQIITEVNQQSSILTIYPVNGLFYGHQIKPDSTIEIQSQEDSPIFLKIQAKNQVLYFSNEITSLETEEKTQIKMINDDSIEVMNFRIIPEKNNNYILLASECLDVATLEYFWNQIYLTPKEDQVIQSLQIIDENIERIGFTIGKIVNMVKVKIKGLDLPIPISRMGQGINRILTLVIAELVAENGVLLIDEIDTGLHYQVMTNVWSFILELAQKLNISIFATTHSWDCLCAFQAALEERKDQSIAKLFRLDRKYGKLRAVEYTAEDIQIAIPNSIEVR